MLLKKKLTHSDYAHKLLRARESRCVPASECVPGKWRCANSACVRPTSFGFVSRAARFESAGGWRAALRVRLAYGNHSHSYQFSRATLARPVLFSASIDKLQNRIENGICDMFWRARIRLTGSAVTVYFFLRGDNSFNLAFDFTVPCFVAREQSKKCRIQMRLH